MNLAWQAPQFLWLLPLALWPLWRRQAAGLTVSSLQPYRATTSWRTRLDRLRPLPAALALALVILLLAGPELQQSEQQVLRRGIDIMLAIDISASMGADDLPPDRISVAREVAAEFLQQRRDDRIGVILFSGIPYLLSPATSDRDRVAALIRRVEADRSGNGTALGDALAASVDRLEQSKASSRVVILLTDGSSNRGELSPLAAARLAAENGVRVYTIGFGTELGGTITLGANPEQRQQLRERLASQTLEQIAAATGGSFFRAVNEQALKQVYAQINRLETSPLETRQRISRRPLTAPLATSLALVLLAELLLFRLWLRRLP